MRAVGFFLNMYMLLCVFVWVLSISYCIGFVVNHSLLFYNFSFITLMYAVTGECELWMGLVFGIILLLGVVLL